MKTIQLIKKALWFLRFMISERKEDRKLGISTCGRNDASADADKHPYEPTPYKVLEKLAATGYIGEDNTLLDYGCGKGRAAIFLSAKTGCRAIGVECEEKFVSAAHRNAASVRQRKKGDSAGDSRNDYVDTVTSSVNASADGVNTSQQCLFLEKRAEDYVIPPQTDRLFFFNPFSVKTLRFVMEKVKASHKENPREILLFFYYPSKRYDQYLRTVKELTPIEDIDCGEFFCEEDSREKIAVFWFTA